MTPEAASLPPAPVTRFILWACILVELGFFLLPFPADQRLAYALALVPARLTLLPAEGAITLVTSQFLHAGMFHLLANMVFLWAVGRPVEWVLGAWRFLALYLLTGVAGGVVQTLVDPMSTIPVVGASGAISGMLAIYAMLFSRSRVASRRVAGLHLSGQVLRVLWFAAAWIGIQLMVAVVFNTGSMGGVAIWAHIGGFLAGLALGLPFIRRKRRES